MKHSLELEIPIKRTGKPKNIIGIGEQYKIRSDPFRKKRENKEPVEIFVGMGEEEYRYRVFLIYQL